MTSRLTTTRPIAGDSNVDPITLVLVCRVPVVFGQFSGSKCQVYYNSTICDWMSRTRNPKQTRLTPTRPIAGDSNVDPITLVLEGSP